LAQAPGQVELAHIPAEEFEATVRGQILVNEFDAQITLDHLAQAPYPQAHQRGLLESKDDVGTSILSMRGNAPLIHFARSFRRLRISDWG
jgi:hypothetical protein